jgi:hypothetical protein
MNTPDFTRRDFVKGLGAATLGALAAGYPCQLLGAEPLEKLPATADTVIVLWMGGGMAATETFDPKRYTPFEKGMNPNTVLSTFPSIPTAVDGIRFSEGLEKTAKVMDRGTLIRSYTAGDLGFILHSRHQFHWHTGYAPPQSVACPHIGATIARTLGPRNPAVPAFINIGQRLEGGEGEELKAFTSAGFLGSEFGPFNVAFPDAAKDVVTPPGGMSPGRFENRDAFYRKLAAASPVGQLGSGHQKESLLRSLDGAHEDAYVAVRDAFRAARRQLEAHARRQRHELKTRVEPAHGRVTYVDVEGEWGLLDASGRQIANPAKFPDGFKAVAYMRTDAGAVRTAVRDGRMHTAFGRARAARRGRDGKPTAPCMPPGRS